MTVEDGHFRTDGNYIEPCCKYVENKLKNIQELFLKDEEYIDFDDSRYIASLLGKDLTGIHPKVCRHWVFRYDEYYSSWMMEEIKNCPSCGAPLEYVEYEIEKKVSE